MTPKICLYIHAYSRCIDMIMYVLLIFNILFLTSSNLNQMGLLCQVASIDIGKIKSGLEGAVTVSSNDLGECVHLQSITHSTNAAYFYPK